VELTAAIEGDLPIMDIDPVRIREVLANLVGNALRHTPTGGRVTVGGATETGWIRLEVRDTGRGVEPDLLPHIFDRFVTGDDSRGSGLGLAIARQLVVAHGGEIAAESVPGTGTIIRVRLPPRATDLHVVDRRPTVLAGPRSAAANTIRTVCPPTASSRR
jgi:signal transduction histidine kinase